MPTTSATSLETRRVRATGRRRIDDARRVQLIAQLEDLMLTEGFAHLTMDELAARLQCSKSTLYAVAASKDRAVQTVLKHFFREATTRIEKRVAPIADPAERIAVYLASVGDEMRRMSHKCHIDMVADDATFEIWALNARASAERVRGFINDGVEAGVFRGIHAAFVGETVSLLIDAIQHGELLERTGLSSGEAYTELSELVLATLTHPTR